MAFSFFSHKSSEQEIALVFDIGSASVGGALVRFTSQETPEIIYTTRTEMVFQEDLTFARFQSAMKQALANTVHQIEVNGIPTLSEEDGQMPTHAYCILASPWYAAKTDVIKRQADISFTVHEDMISTEVEKAIESFQNEDGVKEQLGDGAAYIIERHIGDIRLNGYTVADPYDKQAKTLEMNATFSIAPSDLTHSISQELQRGFGCDLSITFHAFSTAALQMMRSLDETPDAFLFTDIGGEVSDILLIRSDGLQNAESFPIGKRTMVRRLAGKLRTSPAEALSLLRLYQEDRVSDIQKERMDGAISQMKEEWLRSFQQTLEKMSDVAVPKYIYINADTDILQFMGDVIEQEDLVQYGMTEGAFDIYTLTPAFFSGLCRFVPDTPRDVFLILETLFVDTLEPIA